MDNAMQEKKMNTDWQNDTGKLTRCDQMTVTRLRTGCCKATHRNKMERTPRLPVLQCKTHTRTHPLAVERNRAREQRTENREEGAKMLVEYVKNIGLYNGL
jgi:hypothetical protein